MSKPEFVYVTYIETTPEKLWHALTDGDFTPRYWFGVHLRSDWKVGSSFEMVHGDGTVSDTGKVVECDPPRRLAYTFINMSDKYKDEVPALATFELEPYGNLVKLTLTHRGLHRRQQVPRRQSPRDGPRSCPASRACWKPASRWKSPTPR